MNDLEKHHSQVVERRPVDLETPPVPASYSTASLIIGILRRWYIALLVFFVMCAIGVPAIWLLIKPLYSVTGAIRVAPIIPNVLTGKADKGEISNYRSFMNTQAVMITGNQVMQRVADDLADKNLSFFENEATDLLAKLKRILRNAKTAKPGPASILRLAISDRVITAVSDRRTELIIITVKSTKAEEAKQIVDAFIKAYMAVEVSSSTQGEEQKLSVLEEERRILAGKLQSQRQAIHQLAQEYGTDTLDSRQEMMLRRVASLLTELTKVEAHKIKLEAQVQLLEKTKEQAIPPGELLKMRQQYINDDPRVNLLTANIAQLDQEFIVARQILASSNPELERRAKLLEALKAHLEQRKEEMGKVFDDLMSKELAKASNTRLLDARTGLEQTAAYEKRLREVLSEEDTQTIGVGRKQLTIQDLQYQLNLDKEMYDTIFRRIQELEMERKRPGRISVANNAAITHIRDKRVKYTVALMFGAMACGVLLAFLRDKADLSLRTPDDVTKCIGMRIIGTTTCPTTIKRALLPKQVAEDYQTIRANLGLLNSNGMPKKLVVTSPGRQEGKTTFAVNLATSMAKSGKKVLLIDGDLRKPDIAHLLNLPKGSRGVQDVLLGRNFDRVVCSVPSTGLNVLAADSHNTADAYELLALPLTAQYISEVSERYDHVIIDTPPVLAFPDALVWAKIADAVVLTSFAEQTTAPNLKEAKERLVQINVEVLGTVLTNVQVGHGYYHYGYNYYSQDGKRKEKPEQADTKLLLLSQSNEDDSKDANS